MHNDIRHQLGNQSYRSRDKFFRKKHDSANFSMSLSKIAKDLPNGSQQISLIPDSKVNDIWPIAPE
jgi:hypothetical protein